MPREEVQATGPNAVRNRPAPSAGGRAADEGCTLPARRLPTLALPQRNTFAEAAFLCGGLALLLAAGSYLAVRHTPGIAALYDLFPPSIWIGVGIGFLLGGSACVQGLLGLLHCVAVPRSAGLLRALGGLAAGGLAVFTPLAMFLALVWPEC
jgi:hypothetical protein